MQRLVILPLALSLFAIGCADARKTAPTEPEIAPAASLSVAGETSSGAAGTSVCLAYAARRDALKAELANEPGNASLADKAALYDEFVTTNCQ